MNKELTWRALVIGLAGLLVITASSMYVALRMGALPWPTIFVTVVSMAALKHWGNTSMGEINVTHTIMSAGAMVAGGLAFTLPGLWMLDPSARLPLPSLIALTVTGTVLGTTFTSLFHRHLIEEENLPYPMGQAACATLQAGMKGGRSAKVLFSSMGASAIFTAIRDAWGTIPQAFLFYGGSASVPALSMWASPMAVGIGAIIGPVLAFVWFLGMVLGYYALTPIGIRSGLFPDMAAADLFRGNLGIGLMIGTGVGVFIKALWLMMKRRKRGRGRIELSRASLVSLSSILLLCLVLLMVLCSLTLTEALLLLFGVAVTTYLSSMLTGQTGVNPMEIFGILVLLVVGVFSHPPLSRSFTIAAVTAVACGLAGDVMNDLKSGHLLGTEAGGQIIGEGIGGIVGAVISVFVLLALKKAYGSFGTAALPAPQAAAVSAMAGGLSHVPAFLIGLTLGLALHLSGVPTATLGLGFYLSPSISTVMGLGALLSLVFHRIYGKEKSGETISLVSSGFLGGEGITGVTIAIISMF